VASLVGEPLVVDKLGLIKTGPVRGEIRFLSEKYKEKSYPPSPPHYNAKDDFDNMDEEEGEDSDENNDRKHRRIADNQQ
jgi:hypothetical protein